MDVSLVMACVELILELRGETVNFTPEEVEEKVRKIPFVEETTTLNTPPKSVKGRSTKVKSRKILLIAAIISILIAIFAVSSIAFDWNIFDELESKFGALFNMPVNEEVNVNGLTITMNGDSVVYRDLKTALKSENINVLYPTKLPFELTITGISLYQESSKDKVVYSFNDPSFTFTIILNKCIDKEIKNVSTEVLKIKDLECYIIDMPDINSIQIYFEYNGDLYLMVYNNKQELIEVIENLKGSQ